MHISGVAEGTVDVKQIYDAINLLKNTESKLLVAFDELTELYYVMEAENIKLKAQVTELITSAEKKESENKESENKDVVAEVLTE